MADITVNKNRITEEFLLLTAIDAESFNERNMADTLTVKLTELGFDVSEDDAGQKINGNAGNIFATLKGNCQGEPILFAGHMDTVAPGKGKKAQVLEDEKIVSDGTTVLGGDDLTAVVEILEGIRAVKEAGIPHRDIEVLFTVAEEPYAKGSAVFDYSKIKSRDVYTLDMTGPVGLAVTKAPTIISFRIHIRGKAAHAGFEPEKGIHAIKYMSKAIHRLEQGHIDEETTLNIGRISGGSVSNAVPASCYCEGEIRSYNHEKALKTAEYVRRVFNKAVCGSKATVQYDFTVNIAAYEIDKESEVVKRFLKACNNMGIAASIGKTFGGSDNNNFVNHGRNGIVLSCGMYNAHTVNEYTKVEDLINGAGLVAELISVNI